MNLQFLIVVTVLACMTGLFVSIKRADNRIARIETARLAHIKRITLY
jgi:hypothetical protein